MALLNFRRPNCSRRHSVTPSIALPSIALMSCAVLAVSSVTGCGEAQNRQVEETAEMTFDDIAREVAAEESRATEDEGKNE